MELQKGKLMGWGSTNTQFDLQRRSSWLTLDHERKKYQFVFCLQAREAKRKVKDLKESLLRTSTTNADLERALKTAAADLR